MPGYAQSQLRDKAGSKDTRGVDFAPRAVVAEQRRAYDCDRRRRMRVLVRLDWGLASVKSADVGTKRKRDEGFTLAVRDGSRWHKPRQNVAEAFAAPGDLGDGRRP